MVKNGYKILLLSALVLTLSSCSWIQSRRSLFGDQSERPDPNQSKDDRYKTVSKRQYEELKSKYEALLEKRKMERVEDGNNANNFANQFEEKRKNEALKKLSKVNTIKEKKEESEELGSTVDLFNKVSSSGKSKVQVKEQQYSNELIEEHVNKIKKVENLVGQNKLNAAIKILKQLEASPVRQVAVRAKFYLGEILFKQEEYDLALQIYEEILKKNAFSGLVITSLGRLIVCSEKLKINSKKEKYYSMLHDFFEQG